MHEAPATLTPDRFELDALRARLRAYIAQLDAEVTEPVQDEPLIGGLFD
ncbi:hypothetical protein ABS771_18495 [Methylobacterium brachiatum]|uniref:Uncharacterized protein n=1 Tax=Methylobacterium brachiatum TaxID=269660 RepID=A0ABV1R5H2_9HYPH